MGGGGEVLLIRCSLLILIEFGINISIYIKTAMICSRDVTFNSLLILKKIFGKIRMYRTERAKGC